MWSSQHHQPFEDASSLPESQWGTAREPHYHALPPSLRRRPPAPLFLPQRPIRRRYQAPPRPTGKGFSPRLLFFSLGFLGTGFLFVILYPYRMFILHLLIALLLLMLAGVWLVVVVKVRRRIRARRQQPFLVYPFPNPSVHEGIPGRRPLHRNDAYSLRSPDPHSEEEMHTPSFLYAYDDRQTSKRPSERLDPDQRRRF